MSFLCIIQNFLIFLHKNRNCGPTTAFRSFTDFIFNIHYQNLSLNALESINSKTPVVINDKKNPVFSAIKVLYNSVLFKKRSLCTKENTTYWLNMNIPLNDTFHPAFFPHPDVFIRADPLFIKSINNHFDDDTQ